MSSEHGSHASEDDGGPRVNGFGPTPRPPDAVYDPDPVIIHSDETPIRNGNHVPSSPRRQNMPNPHSQASSLVRSTYTDDLESQAVTSDDMSIDDEIILANRLRRRNAPIPLARIATQLRQARAEERSDSVPVTSNSEEDVPIYQNPYPLIAQQRARNPFDSDAATGKNLPPAEGRRVYRRDDGLLAFVAGPSSETSSTFSTTSAYVPADYGYGYGYEGYDRSHFYVLEDTSNKRPVSDPIGLHPDTRFVKFKPCVLAGDEMEVLEAQEFVLDRYEPSLDLFPGVNFQVNSSDDGEPSLSGSASEESPVRDAIVVSPDPSEHRGRSRTRRILN